ncbi:uncharacterized protein LOC133835532 [Drosophila sulfurigaster albostrigata]|uniref:uncharacterized protein LOC133835532 n=1 Tax=Drosophila sulfurigaster albostrigata TaxID=89887 RepID=UPI002D21DA56|nr:uncharacterized protein LOC133835532 [Drosophila sulfurigaster albostrigata]
MQEISTKGAALSASAALTFLVTGSVHRRILVGVENLYHKTQEVRILLVHFVLGRFRNFLLLVWFFLSVTVPKLAAGGALLSAIFVAALAASKARQSAPIAAHSS